MNYICRQMENYKILYLQLLKCSAAATPVRPPTPVHSIPSTWCQRQWINRLWSCDSGGSGDWATGAPGQVSFKFPARGNISIDGVLAAVGEGSRMRKLCIVCDILKTKSVAKQNRTATNACGPHFKLFTDTETHRKCGNKRSCCCGGCLPKFHPVRLTKLQEPRRKPAELRELSLIGLGCRRVIINFVSSVSTRRFQMQIVLHK